MVITELGVVPLSSILKGNEELSFNVSDITNKIQNAFREIAATASGNFGWSGILYPRGNYLLINVPVTTATDVRQYIMNTLTGAWCQFTGQQANCWALLNEELYFGGTGGVVFKADSGRNDNASTIDICLKTAFNYFDDRVRNKRFTLARPLLGTEGSFELNFDVDTDFRSRGNLGKITVTGSTGTEWDDSLWDIPDWAEPNESLSNWYSVTGFGRSAALRLQGKISNVELELSGFHIIFEPGGVF
jgi:hypothetical protein